MNKLEFYLDDYQVIKAYLYKPFDTSSLRTLTIFNHGIEINYKIEELVQTDEYYKCLIILEERFKYDDLIEFSIDGELYPLYYRHIVNHHQFEKDFYTNVHDLGSHFTKEATTFKIWTPLSTRVRLHLLDYQKYYDMDLVDHGVFSLKLDGNYELTRYRYEISRNGRVYEVVDPFAYSSGPNAEYSYILDEKKFISEKFKPIHVMKNYTDAIIYEISVRDFTSSPISGTKYKSKFISLTEEGTKFEGVSTGLDYLKELGVTHIQLMPVFDFGSVDEVRPQNYNWGYDPVQYNVTEGTYCSDLSNPYLRVNELRLMVNKMHENNIRVNLDVVFNHVYKEKEFALAKIMPHYVYRYQSDEELSNGSFCGNEIRSEALMVRDYILLMCERYVKLFDIDGLRFDLMGLTDKETIQKVYNLCAELKPDFMIYGEGWDMPSKLPVELRASLTNRRQLPQIGFFNAQFRDEVKGPTMSDALYHPGYVLGELNLVNSIKDHLSGNCLNGYFLSPNQSINYVECHDNSTFYDKMRICMKGQSVEDEKARVCLGIALTLLAQGVPFIHSGQEYMRTKFGNDNTYNSGDYYNQIDYVYRNQNLDVVNFAKDMIWIRKEYPELRYGTREEIIQNVSFEDYYEVLIYNADRLKIYINPSIYEMLYEVKEPLRVIYNRNAFDDTIVSKTLVIPPLSIIVCARENN